MPIRMDVHDSVAVAAKFFRGLSDPTRLTLLLALLDGEQRVADLVASVGSSQANVSGHLACLRDCGLVDVRPEGRQMFYRLANLDVVEVLRASERLLAAQGIRIDLCANYVGA